MLTALLWLSAAPMIEPHCDAAMVAEHAPTMTQSQYEEVVHVVWQMGGLTSKDAEALLRLIEEAYKTKDLGEWARAKCGEVKS